MTNYSENSGSVRVEYFKPSGKWYMTEAIDMSAHWDDLDIYKAVEDAIQESRPDRPSWFKQFHVVVMEPYHKNAYPVMITATED